MRVTHYDTLGVRRDATEPQIRRAYHKLVRQFHPDKLVRVDPSAAAEAGDRMRAVNAAWQVLGNSRRRRQYDRELEFYDTVTRPVPKPRAPRDDDHLFPPDPGPVDWRLKVVRALPYAVVLGVLFAIFVFTAYAR